MSILEEKKPETAAAVRDILHARQESAIEKLEWEAAAFAVVMDKAIKGANMKAVDAVGADDPLHALAELDMLTESVEFMRLELQRRIDFWCRAAHLQSVPVSLEPSPAPSPSPAEEPTTEEVLLSQGV